MVQYNPSYLLPTEDDLPDSDEQPVDNELQLRIPGLLLAILQQLWAGRQDWFFGLNIGLYYDPNLPAIGPDALLSLGVERLRGERGRLSYVLWQEQVVPLWVLEVVSQKPGKEYSEKLAKYAKIGVLYYLIYNPDHWRRDKHESFELYRLVNGSYQRQSGNPIWMPELELGIGYETDEQEGWRREWLYWYDVKGNRYPTPTELAQQAHQQAEQERNRAEQERNRAEQAEQELQTLLAKLRQQGIEPTEL